MKTNIPIEQAVVDNSNLKKDHHINRQPGKNAHADHLAELDNDFMMSTSEILDFASGIDSTEYDQPDR